MRKLKAFLPVLLVCLLLFAAVAHAVAEPMGQPYIGKFQNGQVMVIRDGFTHDVEKSTEGNYIVYTIYNNIKGIHSSSFKIYTNPSSGASIKVELCAEGATSTQGYWQVDRDLRTGDLFFANNTSSVADTQGAPNYVLYSGSSDANLAAAYNDLLQVYNNYFVSRFGFDISQIGGIVNDATFEWGADVVSAPVVSGIPTTSSITVSPVSITPEVIQTVEYAISTSASELPTSGWQAETTFDGLAAGTTYYVYARAAENDNFIAGVAKVSTGITTSTGLADSHPRQPYNDLLSIYEEDLTDSFGFSYTINITGSSLLPIKSLKVVPDSPQESALHTNETGCLTCPNLKYITANKIAAPLTMFKVESKTSITAVISFKMILSSVYNGKEMTIVHCSSNGPEVSYGTVRGGILNFKSNGLSPFAIFEGHIDASLFEDDGEAESVTLPKTGGNEKDLFGVWLTLAVALAWLMSIALRLKQRA